MQPRLKTSKKWTPLPKELLEQIRSIFSSNFAEQTKGGVIEASGRIYPDEILFRVGFRAPKALRQQNWEISIGYKRNKDNVMMLLHTGVDVIGALFEQLFAAENDHDFPRLWEEVDFEKRKIHVQYTTVNTELESEADRLLGLEPGEELIAQGEWDDGINPDVIKATLGIDPDAVLDDEDEEDPAEVKPRKDH